MSSKAFRLVDELKSAPSKKAVLSCVRKAVPVENVKSASAVEKDKCALFDAVQDDARDTFAVEGISVTEITPLDGGEWVAVVLAEGKNRHRIRLLTQQYAELRPTLGRVTDEEAACLMDAGKLCDAIQKGMELLGYGAMSRRRLAQKLTARKIGADVVAEAVDYLASHGYLPETEDAVRFAEQGIRKLWGPRRIKEDLFARGFPSEVVEVAMESLDEVDFSKNCARVIQKKFGVVPKDNAEIKKMVAALMRLGYTSDQIREAMRR